MSPTTYRSRRLLTGSLVLLALAWVLAPAGPRPPLYDGVGFPDEPYRYVTAPAGSKPTAPPTDAVDTQPAGDASPDLAPTSQELGPQAKAVIPGDSLVLPAGATEVTARLQPQAPQPPLPTDGTIWGDVYRLTVTSPQGHVGVRPTTDGNFYLDLRAPTADQPPPVVEAYLLGGWHRLHTKRDGNDVYGARLVSTGRYALVRLTHPDQAADDTGLAGVLWPVAVILVGALALVVLASLAIRRARRRASGPPPA